jgi:hypothetical protein
VANISDYLEDKLLDHSLGTTSFTMPSTIRVALYTTNPTDADSGTEVSGGSYARTAATFSAASGGATTNSADITFPVATASWGTITHVGIRDASSGGNLLWHGALSASKTIDNGDQFKLAAGELDVTLA